jgi:hypothetical protein
LAGTSGSLPGEDGDPKHLLQAIYAACTTQSAVSADKPGADIPPPLQEEDVNHVIHWLAQLGERSRPNAPGHEASSSGSEPLSAAAKAVLLDTVASVAGESNQRLSQPVLVTLAEHLAIRFALEKYESGEAPFNAVQKTLDTLKHEITNLRRVLNTREAALDRAGVAVEPYAEELDRQFWAAVPVRNKLQVLLSADAWCVPPKNIRSFVEELCKASDDRTATHLLKNYCRRWLSDPPDSIRKVSAGLAELADLYAAQPTGLLEPAMECISAAFAGNASGPCRDALVNALACLAREAEKRGNYAAINWAFLSLEPSEPAANGLSHQLRQEIHLDDRVAEFVDKALQASEPELLNVLRRIPEAVAEQLAFRFTRSATRQECDQLKRLAEELRTVLCAQWQRCLLDTCDEQAIQVLGILTAVDSALVKRLLPARLRQWSSCRQALAIHHLSASGATDRGRLLISLLEELHPLVVPQALEEVGISGCPENDTSVLLDMAQGAGLACGSPYLQLKAIEAVGRLRLRSAISHLTELMRAKSRWGRLQHPKEIRIAALQALLRIDTPRGLALASATTGISEQELWLTPLMPGSEGWLRHRRYPRVVIGNKLEASVTSAKESFWLTLEKLSLGGGIGVATMRMQSSTEATVKFRVGLRSVRLRALMREESPFRISFEIASMELEDRSRLRDLLISQLPAGRRR